MDAGRRAERPEHGPPTVFVRHEPVQPFPTGVRVAGFTQAASVGGPVRVTPGSAVGIVIDCTPGSLHSSVVADGAAGFVSGLSPGIARMTGNGIDVIEIEIDPVVAHHALGIPLVELRGTMLDLGDIWGARGVELREQLVAETRRQERFAIVRRALRTRPAPAARVDPEVVHAWGVIRSSGGRVRIGDLAAQCGWDRTRLWRRFSAQIGVSPKEAGMAARFESAIRRLGAGVPASRVAADCGYADQAHLARESVEFAGRTPRQIATDPLWQSNGSTPREG